MLEVNVRELNVHANNDIVLYALKKIKPDAGNVVISSYGYLNIKLTDEETSALSEEIKNTVILFTKRKILSVYDKYNILLKKHISGDDVSAAQLEEYNNKAIAIAAENKDYFQVEADILGLELDDVYDSAVAANTVWQANYQTGLQMLGGFRRKLNTILDYEPNTIDGVYDNIACVKYMMDFITKKGTSIFEEDILTVINDSIDAYKVSLIPVEEVKEEVVTAEL